MKIFNHAEILKKAINRTGYGIVFFIIVFAVQIPLFCGLILKLHHFSSELDLLSTPLTTAIVLLIVFVPFLTALYISIAPRIAEKNMLFCLLIFIFLSRLFFILYVDQHPVSDFSRMWNYTLNIVNTHQFISPVSLPEMRTLPYLLPITYLFQGSPFGFKLVNCLTITFSAFLIYYSTSLLFNRSAGLIALTIIAFTPETLFATEIPTHNIPGAFFLISSITSGVIIIRSINITTPSFKKLTISSLLFGFSITLADLQRNLGVFIFLSILLGAVVLFTQKRDKVNRLKLLYIVAYFILIPYLCSFTLIYAVQKYVASDDYIESMKRFGWSTIAFHANSQSLGNVYTSAVPLIPYLNNLWC